MVYFTTTTHSLHLNKAKDPGRDHVLDLQPNKLEKEDLFIRRALSPTPPPHPPVLIIREVIAKMNDL